MGLERPPLPWGSWLRIPGEGCASSLSRLDQVGGRLGFDVVAGLRIHLICRSFREFLIGGTFLTSYPLDRDLGNTDFLDPMHHTAATGRSSYNLDGWMLSR